MTLFECLRTYLLANSSLAAKVPGGFSPGSMPQNKTVYPLCVVRCISGVPELPTHDNGPSPWTQMRIELTFWGDVYKTLEQAALLGAKSFQVPVFLGGGSNGQFGPVNVLGPRDLVDADTKLMGVQIDIMGMLNRDTLS